MTELQNYTYMNEKHLRLPVGIFPYFFISQLRKYITSIAELMKFTKARLSNEIDWKCSIYNP